MQTTTANLSPNAARWIRISAIITMLVVALSSAVLSFDGLQKLALASHVPSHLAFLFPIAVDMTILMGSLAVLLYEMFGIKAKFGWFTVLFGTGLSVTGNVISVSDAGLIAQVLHGIIPILLCISLESLLRILRFNIRRSTSDGQVSTEESSAHGDIPALADSETATSEPSPTTDPILADDDVALIPDTTEEADSPVAVDTAPALSVERDTNVESPRQRREREELQASVPSDPVEVATVALSLSEKSGSPASSEVFPVALPVRHESVPVVAETSSQHHPDAIAARLTERIPSAAQVSSDIPQRAKSVETAPTPETATEKAPAAQSVPVKAEAPAEKSARVEQAASKKTSSKKRPAAAIPPLADYEREDFKALIESLPDDAPAVQKLGSVFKVKDSMPAADVRWLLGYEDGKRVDSLVRRAREWAAAN